MPRRILTILIGSIALVASATFMTAAANPAPTVPAVGTGSQANTAAKCASGWLCTYHNGVARNYYHCTTVYLSNWTGPGYIVNNQTPGTVSTFYRADGSTYIRDVAPDLADREVNWDPIWSFRVC